jgi:hypothetical protein
MEVIDFVKTLQDERTGLDEFFQIQHLQDWYYRLCFAH